MDPSCFPAVTHPVPFGLTGQQLLQIIEACWSDRTAGLAMSEFAPARDRDEQSLTLAVWLMDWLMLKLLGPTSTRSGVRHPTDVRYLGLFQLLVLCCAHVRTELTSAATLAYMGRMSGI